MTRLPGVLTSCITAAAITTALVRWLPTRSTVTLYIGRIVGFTIASMLCGAARSLAQTLLDIYPQGILLFRNGDLKRG